MTEIMSIHSFVPYTDLLCLTGYHYSSAVQEVEIPTIYQRQYSGVTNYYNSTTITTIKTLVN